MESHERGMIRAYGIQMLEGIFNVLIEIITSNEEYCQI